MSVDTLTAERCAIVLDSTSDLPDCRERHANMRMVPLTVRFGDEELLDYEEISPQRFYERLASDPQPPRTAAPPPERFAACYRELLEVDGYEHVLSLHLSEALSATVSSARLAADECGGRVTVVDTRTVSIALALAALGIARQLEAGPCELDDAGRRGGVVPPPLAPRVRVRDARVPAAQRAHRPRRRRSSAACSACGRCSRSSRARSSRSARCAATRACSRSSSGSCARTRAPTSALRVGIAHAQAEGIANDIAERVRSVRPQSVIELVAPLGAVVGTNTGPGGAGLVWAREPG